MKKEKVQKHNEERKGLETHRIKKKSRHTTKKEKVQTHNEGRKGSQNTMKKEKVQKHMEKRIGFKNAEKKEKGFEKNGEERRRGLETP